MILDEPHELSVHVSESAAEFHEPLCQFFGIYRHAAFALDEDFGDAREVVDAILGTHDSFRGGHATFSKQNVHPHGQVPFRTSLSDL